MDDNVIELGNDEIWDDSMLIDSWNQALDEYKKYHSIKAKGGSVEDLERELSSSSKSKAQEVASAQGTSEAENADESLNHLQPAGETHDEPLLPKDSHSSQAASAIPPAFPSQAILGSIRDDGLKKLLMSWYYAGYYTGLYEAQQQAQQQQS